MPEPIAGAPTEMRAITHATYANPPALELRRVPVPAPAPDEILVRVRASPVSPAVWHLAAGRPQVARLAVGLRRPKQLVAGREFAGEIVACGVGVERWTVGDRVFGLADGAWADYAVARDRCAAMPDGVDELVAAAVPDSGITALQAVRDHATVGADERVLVIGGSGGVGHLAAQLARLAGAEVTATASPEKLAALAPLAARGVHLVDRRATPITALPARSFDAVIDTGGHTPLRVLRRLLTPRGRLVIVGSETDGAILGGIDRPIRARVWSAAPWVGQRMRGMFAAEHSDDLEHLAGLLADGRLTPIVGATAPLDDAPAALAELRAGRAVGKIVLRVA